MRFKVVKALAYRELYLVRKKLIGTAVSFLIMSVLSLLVLLSFYHGNIGLALRDVMETPEAALAAMTPEERAEVIPVDTAMDIFKKVLAIGIKFYPILMAGFVVVSIGENCVYDENKPWQYFYRSTPATPLEKAAATYSIFIAFDILGIILSLLFSLLISALTGVPIYLGDIAFIIGGIAVGNVFSVLIHLGIKYFHSLDKAGIALVGTAFVCIFGYNLIVNLTKDPAKIMQEAHQETNTAELLTVPGKIEEAYNGLAEKILPIAIPAAIIAPIVGFTVYYLICKRREK